jgi:hypothetical protein
MQSTMIIKHTNYNITAILYGSEKQIHSDKRNSMDFRIHKTRVIFEKLGSRRVIFHDHCNYTCVTRELHKTDFFLIAELPEAFLSAREKACSQTEMSTRVPNEPKFVSFFQKM